MHLPIRIGIFFNVKNGHEIWKYILNFPKQDSFRIYSYHLFYNQEKSAFILLKIFGICYPCHNLAYFNNKAYITKNTAFNRKH